jgi:hypothetical protein
MHGTNIKLIFTLFEDISDVMWFSLKSACWSQKVMVKEIVTYISVFGCFDCLSLYNIYEHSHCLLIYRLKYCRYLNENKLLLTDGASYSHMINSLYPQVLPSAYFVNVGSMWNMNIIFLSKCRIFHPLLEFASEWIQTVFLYVTIIVLIHVVFTCCCVCGNLYSSSSVIMQHSLISMFVSIFLIKHCWKKWLGGRVILWLSVCWTVYHQ